MMTTTKTAKQIAAMREGGKILATIFAGLRDQVHAGVSERELDAWVAHEITALGATATYKEPSVNFPGVICISTNDQVVHGVPTDYVLQQGDIVGFDLVISYKGMKTDSAFSVVVDTEPTGDAKRLLTATEQSLQAAIAVARPGNRTGDIGAAVSGVLDSAKLGIVRDLVGHGIGQEMHMAPDIPNYGKPGTGTFLEVGDTLAIEPMATLGTYQVKVADDGWTIVTQDGSLAAHFEHTVLITEDGAEVLTSL
jgi:methionyl aminopeptidase